MAATSIDKSDWGAGPWQSEPDFKQWTDAATGYECVLARGPGGHLCGYVGIPAGHPWHSKDYNATVDVPDSVRDRPIDIDKIGVINLFCATVKGDDIAAGRLDIVLAIDVHGGLTYARDKAPGAEKDGRWWFGFDCAHSGDLTPGSNAKLPAYLRDARDDVYREAAYVEAECASLAKQLAAFVP